MGALTMSGWRGQGEGQSQLYPDLRTFLIKKFSLF